MQGARRLFLLLLTAFWLLAGSQQAGATLLPEGFASVRPADVQLLRDPGGHHDVNSLLAAGDPGWQPARAHVSLGFSHDTIWLRFPLQAAPGVQRALVEIGYPLLDEIDVYELRGETLLNSWNLGDNRPLAGLPLAHRFPLVAVDFPAGATEKTLLLRIRSDGAMEIPLRIWSMQGLAAHESRALPARGAAWGLMLVVMLAFVIAALTTRARGFAYYLPYALALLVYHSLIDGTAALYLGLDGNWWGSHGVIVAIWLIPLTGTLFLSAFIDTEHNMPRVHHAFDIAEIGLLLCLGVSLLLPASQVYPLLLPIVGAYAIAVCVIALYAASRQVPLARSFLLGTVLLFAGALLSVLGQFGLIGTPVAIGDALLVGILLQAVVLAWALSLHLEATSKTHRAAQLDAMAQQESALARQQQLVAGLEQRVTERSEALWQAMRQLETTNRQLADLSRRDGLTGVHNRRHFDERFPEMVRLASRRGSPIAVLMLDLDHFKQLNDQRGHAIGDECLRLIAATLGRVVSRSTDLVARYGGEEFVVVLPDATADSALAIAEALREDVSQLRVPCGKVDLKFSVSIGLVLHVPQPGDDGRQLLAEADAALYRAKQNGRNRVEAVLA